MPERIQFEIDAADAPDYIEIVQRKRQLVDEEIERKQAEVKGKQAELNELVSKSTQLGFVLERLRGNQTSIKPTLEVVGKPIPPKKPINDYDASWSIWDKVQYVLRKQVVPVTKVEIIEKIGLFEPRVAAYEGKKKRQFSVSISACLTTKSSEKVGKLKKVVRYGEDNKYYLPNE